MDANESTKQPHGGGSGMTRRECVSVLGGSAGSAALGLPLLDVEPAQSATGVYAAPLTLAINGAQHRMTIDPRETLLDLLRERMGLTGTKKGCGHGQCGACTVLVNGRRVNSCLSLAVSHDGDHVTTIEGLAQGGVLDPVQAAFIEYDGLQCGYCTPGQICSAMGLLSEISKGDASFVTRNPQDLGPVQLSDEEIRERMSGNLCRCGAYPGIVAAVKTVSASTGNATRKKGRRL